MSFKNILLFGAGGTSIGPYIFDALVKDGTFNTTVLARQSSKTAFPDSASVIRVADEFHHQDLVQEVVICAVGILARTEQYKLIDAAVEAGVRRFIPSDWGMDNGDPKNQQLCPVFRGKGEVEQYLRSKESETFS